MDHTEQSDGQRGSLQDGFEAVLADERRTRAATMELPPFFKANSWQSAAAYLMAADGNEPELSQFRKELERELLRLAKTPSMKDFISELDKLFEEWESIHGEEIGDCDQVNVKSRYKEARRERILEVVVTRGGPLPKENRAVILKRREKLASQLDRFIAELLKEPGVQDDEDGIGLEINNLYELADTIRNGDPLGPYDPVTHWTYIDRPRWESTQTRNLIIKPQAGRSKAGGGRPNKKQEGDENEGAETSRWDPQQLLMERALIIALSPIFDELNADGRKPKALYCLAGKALVASFSLDVEPDPDDIAARWRNFLKK